MGADPPTLDKLNEHDEGALAFAITHHNGNVIVQFASPVSWMAMPPVMAKEFAKLLNQHADEALGEAH